MCSRTCTWTSCIPHYKRTPGCALVLVPAGLLGTGTGTRGTAYNKSIRGTCTPYVHPNAGDSYRAQVHNVGDQTSNAQVLNKA